MFSVNVFFVCKEDAAVLKSYLKYTSKKEPMTGYNLQNISFLVVDDNAHMRSLLRTILCALGAKKENILEAVSGEQAFDVLRVGPVDLCITDWKMEPVSGIEFVKRLRLSKDSPNPFLPVILLTGHTELKRVLIARDAGVNEFLAKPISPKELYVKIHSIIENPRPFIRTETYFGPDRRRRDVPFEGEDRRRKAPEPLHDSSGE